MANDAQGSLYVNIEGQIPTYSTTVAAYSPYSSATDIVVLQNPSTSTIIAKIAKIRISGTASASSILTPYLYLRSALNTGGTSTVVADAPHDLIDVASQANLSKYSAAPTLNGTAYLLRADEIILANASTPVNGQEVDWIFGDVGNIKQIHVRPGQQLSINLNGSVPSGSSLYLTIQWAEAPL